MSNDFDDDPPTVVAAPRKTAHEVVLNHRIELGWWSFVSPAWRPAFLRITQFLTWLASL